MATLEVMIHARMNAGAGAAPGPQHEFWLYGTEGTLHLDVDSGRLEVALASEGGQLRGVEVAEGHRGHWRVEEEFINAIRWEMRKACHPSPDYGHYFVSLISFAV